MKRIKLTSESRTPKEITVSCEGTSGHIWNRTVVHGMSQKGLEWLVQVDSQRDVYVDGNKLDYVTFNPLP